MTRIRIVLCCAVVCLPLVACATRPAEAKLTEAILTATAAQNDIDLSAEVAACIARHLLASDLSDTTLAGLAEDFDAPEVLEVEINDVRPLVTEAAAACQPKG